MWRIALALALIGTGCSRRDLPLPDLPAVRVESFQPVIRGSVEKACAEVQSRPRDAQANGKLGMVLEAYEQNQLAEICYQRARALDPSSFEWAYYLGAVQEALGKHKEAAASLRDAVGLKPDYVAARLKLADTLFAAANPKESERIYAALRRENASLPQPYYGLGRVKAAAGDLSGAVEDYSRACELFPNYGAARYALALAYRRLGDAAKAQEHMAVYQKAPLAEPPLDDPLRAAMKQLNAGAQQHLSAGVRLEAAGQIEQAIAEHERALEIDPKVTQAHVNLISLYGRTNRTAKAEEQFRAALAIDPNNAECYYNFGVLLYEQGKYREAGGAFRKAVEINPYYAEAHNNLGFVLEREGRPDEAVKRYRTAIDNKPNYRLAHFHLGRLLLSRGKSAEAIEQLQQTLAPEDESTPGFLYGLGAAYARKGDREHALQYIREARQRAASLGQAQLLASIDRDLRTLEQRP